MPRKRKENEPLAEFKQQIESVQEGVRLIRESGISDEALFLLIQRASPSYGVRPARKVSIRMIRAVIEGMDALKDFVFPEEEDGYE